MTLVELVITIVVISIAMVAVLTAFSGAMGRSADPLWRNKTLKLAQLYLDEMTTKKFDETTPVGGVPASTAVTCSGLGAEEADRSLYDDVDDYHNLNETPPLNQKGGALNGYAGYRVQVSVTCSGTLVGAADDSQIKKISLTITPPGEAPVLFSSFVGNF
ncbi:MAG: type II secretion system protein [Hahellaceae bacterium]|nr:type II secretion system protein [Hahellaceae bacterium]MCP5168588.1 type II secretion system protein [Hahellaceae bacterium]